MDCGDPFIEGQAISERLVSLTEWGGRPVFVVEVLCFDCGVKAVACEGT